MTDDEIDHVATGRVLVDVALHRWRSANETQPLRVRGVRADRFGGFVLGLDEDYMLEIFVNASSAAHDSHEYWRLLRPGKPDLGHFVVLDSGIDPEDSGIDSEPE